VSYADELRRTLTAVGIEETQQKTILDTMATEGVPTIRLDKALPFPIYKEETKDDICEVCRKKQGGHSPLTFFVFPEHKLEILRLFDLMERTLSIPGALVLKMGSRTTESLTTPREMVDTDKSFLLQGRLEEMNVMDEYYTYLTNYAELREDIRVTLESLGSFTDFYKDQVAFYVDEYYCYKKRYEGLPESEAARKDAPFETLRTAYEEVARKEYDLLQTNLSLINQRIMRLKEKAEKYEKKERFEDIRQIVEDRDRLSYLQPRQQRTARTRRPR